MSSTNHRRILLIDDDFVLQEILSLTLAAEGYMVVTAGNGYDAIARLRSCEPVDLILLDLSMPGMDGPQFREAQKATPCLSGIPIVIFSGSEQAEQIATKLGAVACLRKPAGSTELLETIRRCLEPSHVKS
jgi:CheY-like chemotaxis protein